MEKSDLQVAGVPVFSASGVASNPVGAPVTFQRLEFASKTDHGVFKKGKGLFIVKTAGIYQFVFNGVSWEEDKSAAHVEIRIDGKCIAATEVNSPSTKKGKTGSNMVIVTMVSLKSGSQVGVYTTGGNLSTMGAPDDRFTRFMGTLLQQTE